MTDAFRSPERRWAAVVERDAAADGAFLYAVRSTGVVCRPGCASRTPKREHVAFFDTFEEAQRAGFRPCRRCTPDERSPQERFAAQAVRACRRLEVEEPEPTLDALASEAGLSRAHFQRSFKRAVGLTPKQYARTKRAERFRAGLPRADTVTEAIYGAGFGSSSRAYEAAAAELGMTPSAYRAGAPGQVIRYGVAACSLGWLVVAASDRGICAIEFGDDPETLPARVRGRFPGAQLEEGGPAFARVLEGVVGLVEAPATGLGLPLDIRGTAFQQRVWDALRQVPPGRTVGYAELAARIGRPEAARAVAGACAANGLAVAIPCHRVVRADGQLSGYRWGVERKRALLERERASRDES
jgi:AraC family transcriptional regulator, regulatory protein of adaptative response / methylated-DNA-[protein]-cysteine methyltransferase